jgi:hypothetical protein
MKLDIVVVDDACNSSYRLSPPVSQEEDHLGMGTERMLRAKFEEGVLDERWNPMPIGFINLPGESREGMKVLPILNFFNLEFLSCHPIGLRFRKRCRNLW